MDFVGVATLITALTGLIVGIVNAIGGMLSDSDHSKSLGAITLSINGQREALVKEITYLKKELAGLRSKIQWDDYPTPHSDQQISDHETKMNSNER